MKTKLIIFCLLLVQFGFAQQNRDGSVFSAEAAEEIFIHYNAPLLIPGESLYYKVYNLINANHQKSDISKIVNVKLLKSNGDVVFHHILNLEEGASYSDYLIPADLPSGIYSLIGYTNWMKNHGLKGIFDSKILIINPYLKNADENISISEEQKSSGFTNNELSAESDFQINLNKDIFDRREKIEVSLLGDLDVLEQADFSVSVRKVEEVPGLQTVSSKNLDKDQVNDFQVKFIPEMRGRILSGKIENKNNTVLDKDLSVAYFVPNSPEKFRVFETSKDGSFKFVLQEPIKDEKAYLKVIDDSDYDYQILIDSSLIDYEVKQAGKVVIPNSVKNEIEQRAIYNQIQQSYLAKKADAVVNKNSKGNFFGDKAMLYDLDNYTRFSTVPEVFVEIIQFASFKKEGDMFIPNIRTYNTETDFGNPPLLIIDGVVILDYNTFYYMDAKLIEKIYVVRDKYFYGPEVYQGIILVETVKVDTPAFSADHSLEMIPTEPIKDYYSPDYSTAEKRAELSRIPDYRSQLFWSPELSANKFEFFTSDIIGTFQIKIEGFQKNGEAISLEKTFQVRD
ncbi:hypothetical protein C8P64_1521 [Christiangramia gaetbulicola]|uniref:Cyclic nucleotide-binding domain-containing protein n=1 Tax=Christiangramia gaetbulicola TaxID=703340 RepID=A0A2T6AGS8_9FLAO|nr:hypothetical protein [Christiangramia gaetbulicola]PTX42997.1 hypothetical protein C8P64_1521 [Christiangramia gaetbulicola]